MQPEWRMPPDADFFRALEHRRTRALVDRDLATLEALHAPDYELVTPGGRVFTRAEYLGRIASEPFYSGWELGTIACRVGADMAALRYHARLSFPSGRSVSCWHTDLYGLREQGWQALWSQATEIRG